MQDMPIYYNTGTIKISCTEMPTAHKNKPFINTV